jgi:hypothetical protein
MFMHFPSGTVLKWGAMSRVTVGFLLLALAACSQIPAPDDNISKDAIDIYSKTLSAMDDATVKPYSQSKRPQFYQQAQDLIQVMQLRAEGSGNPSDQAILSMGNDLSVAFATMREDDRASWEANNQKGKEFKIKSDLDAIQSNIVTILRHQQGLKGLSDATGSPASTPAKPKIN